MNDRDGAFHNYLEAKLSVDDRSLNKEIFARFLSYVRSRATPSIIDIGTGTGAMLRRIIQAGVPPGTCLFGLDPDDRLLKTAQREIAGLLSRRGYNVRRAPLHVTAKNTTGSVSVHLMAGDLLDPSLPQRLGRRKFDAVTANALMDMLPVEDALVAVSRLLKSPDGLLYATINYDGNTSFLPLYGDRDFEEKLLEVYNRSMDNRRMAGKMTGGSRGGSALFSAAEKLGFMILEYGSSDWCVHPAGKMYGKDDERFLAELLDIFYQEERLHPEIDAGGLEAWHEERRRRLRNGTLSLVVHQTDLLARRPAEV